jgi:DNA polymerase elongation subunit (family B)
MSKYKHPDFLKRYGLNLYYTDTDSLYFDGPLTAVTDDFVSNTILGKLKLEGIWDKALFLGPKCYVLENNEEKELDQLLNWRDKQKLHR